MAKRRKRGRFNRTHTKGKRTGAPKRTSKKIGRFNRRHVKGVLRRGIARRQNRAKKRATSRNPRRVRGLTTRTRGTGKPRIPRTPVASSGRNASTSTVTSAVTKRKKRRRR